MKICFFLRDDFKWDRETTKNILGYISLFPKNEEIIIILDNDNFLKKIKSLRRKLKLSNKLFIIKAIESSLESYSDLTKNIDIIFVDIKQIGKIKNKISNSFNGKFIFL